MMKMFSPRARVNSDLSLDHGRPLRPQHLHRLEDVHHAFVAHPLQDDAEGDEDSGPTHAGAGKTQSGGVSFSVSVALWLNGCFRRCFHVALVTSPTLGVCAKIDLLPSNICIYIFLSDSSFTLKRPDSS